MCPWFKKQEQFSSMVLFQDLSWHCSEGAGWTFSHLKLDQHWKSASKLLHKDLPGDLCSLQRGRSQFPTPGPLCRSLWVASWQLASPKLSDPREKRKKPQCLFHSVLRSHPLLLSPGSIHENWTTQSPMYLWKEVN